MKREELLKSATYWTVNIQMELFRALDSYMKKNNLKRKDLAEKLNVSKGYISQVLNGDFDHKISKMVELALAADKIPVIEFKDKEQYIQDDLNDVAVKPNYYRPIEFHLFVEGEQKSNICREDFMAAEEYYTTTIETSSTAQLAIK
jgi:transcriptional regulator with XRE-family HTH domain